MNNKNKLIKKLNTLDLSTEESLIYIELLKKPNTHMQLSRSTEINRTKVYRIIENLEKRSLVARRTDDRGTFLVAADPSTLEIEVVKQEKKAKNQRQILTHILPSLKTLQTNDTSLFVVHTYEGIEGLKQMVWHELKTKGELTTFGGQTIEDIIDDHRWSNRHRNLTVEAGYTVREIINPDIDPPTFTNNQEFMKNHYQYRTIPSELIYFSEQIVIYNDTVSVYHWRENKKVGVEIISKTYANMLRIIFDHYWRLAK